MSLDWTKILNQIVAFFRGLTARQRAVLAASVVLVAGSLWGLVWFSGQGDYKPLYSGLAPDEAQNLVRRLATENIAAQLSSDGATLSVPAGKLDKARLELASEGLPRSGRMGFEIFDKPNWAGSDFVEQVNYQRALEGELERTIESMTGVEAVRVHLALAHESLFTEREREAKAAVLVKLRPRARLSDQDLDAISYLVSSSVENLKPENVRVVNADGHVPLLSHGTTRPRGSEDFENSLTQKLLATLGPVLGPDQIRADVTVEYETGSNESTQETYDPNASAVLSSQTNVDQEASQLLGGIPGSTSNVPQVQSQNQAQTQAQNTTTAANLGPGRHSENKTYVVSRMVRHTIQPAGAIKKISAAVLVDDAVEVTTQNNKKVETRRKRTPDEIKQIEALASAAIGIDTARGDRLAVENISFGSSLSSSETLTPPTLAQRLPSVINQWAPVLRYPAMVLLFAFFYLLVLRPLKRQLASSFRAPSQATPQVAALQERPTPGQVAIASASPASSPRLAEIQPGTTQTATLKEALALKAASEPVEISRLIQDWVRQQ